MTLLHFGRFGWHDLNTNDVDSSAAFYTELFGWSLATDLRPNNYRALRAGDSEFGGIFPMPAEAAGMKTHWSGYVLVENTTATAEQARALGGHTPFDSMPIPGIGDLGIVIDPTGAAVTTFRPAEIMDDWPLGPGGAGETVLWNELITTDLAGSVAFYTELFGWEVDQATVDAGDYVVARRGGKAVGAFYAPDASPAVSAWITYFNTSDIAGTVARVASLGGTVIHPVTTIPGIGKTAWVNDPLDATFGLMQAEEGWTDRLLPSNASGN